MSASEEISEKIPNLDVAKWIFELSTAPNTTTSSQLHKTLTENDMTFFYQMACTTLNWTEDPILLTKMRQNNSKALQGVDNELQYATDNLGDVEVKKLRYNKAKYYASIGDRENALSILDSLLEKSNTVGQNLQYNFLKMRIYFFYLDTDNMRGTIEIAQKFVDDAGDWEHRNRLKIYRGLYLMTIRDFRGAAVSFQDGVSTYTCTELMSYAEFVTYSIWAYIFASDRRELKKNVINSSDIQEALFSLPLAKTFFDSFYHCKYKVFFVALGEVESLMKGDRYMRPHYCHYVSHVKLKGYKQLLESYSSLSISYMADLFGVTSEYIDRELSMYVGCGKLGCTINKVDGIVETTRKDVRSVQYQHIIRLGDKLLNRMQKLSRVINL